MAATNAPETNALLSAGRFRLLRELGSRSVPTFAALVDGVDGKSQLFVVERLFRGGAVSDEDAADYIRDARRVQELIDHPNIARMRDVAIRSEDVLALCDYIDGEPLADVMKAGAPLEARPPLEVILRVLVDVLTGLGTLHNLRDVKKQPLKLVHGELTPRNLIVGTDGSTRIVHVCHVKALRARSAADSNAYLAPEVLLQDGAADARADIYSVGVILWEALSGKRLFAEANPHAIVAQILSGKVPRAIVPPELAWAKDLANVATRAMMADPGARYPNAAAMTVDLRAIATTKLATTGRVASHLKTSAGAKIAERRAQLIASAESGVVPSAPANPKDSSAARVARAFDNVAPPSNDGDRPTPVAAFTPPKIAEDDAGVDVSMDDEPTTTGPALAKAMAASAKVAPSHAEPPKPEPAKVEPAKAERAKPVTHVMPAIQSPFRSKSPTIAGFGAPPPPLTPKPRPTLVDAAPAPAPLQANPKRTLVVRKKAAAQVESLPASTPATAEPPAFAAARIASPVPPPAPAPVAAESALAPPIIATASTPMFEPARVPTAPPPPVAPPREDVGVASPHAAMAPSYAPPAPRGDPAHARSSGGGAHGAHVPAELLDDGVASRTRSRTRLAIVLAFVGVCVVIALWGGYRLWAGSPKELAATKQPPAIATATSTSTTSTTTSTAATATTTTAAATTAPSETVTAAPATTAPSNPTATAASPEAATATATPAAPPPTFAPPATPAAKPAPRPKPTYDPLGI